MAKFRLILLLFVAISCLFGLDASAGDADPIYR